MIGRGTGINRVIAWHLAAAGAQVTINGMTGMVMDVRDEADVVARTAAAVEVCGPVQIRVASAGIAKGRAVHKTTLALWQPIRTGHS